MPGIARIVVPLLACFLLAALALAWLPGARHADARSAGADVAAAWPPTSAGYLHLRMSYVLAADEVPKAGHKSQYGGGTAVMLAGVMLAAFAAAAVHARRLRRMRASELVYAAPGGAAEGRERVGADLCGQADHDLPGRIERDAPATEPLLRAGGDLNFEGSPPIEAFGELEDAPIGLPPQGETIERLASLLAARDLEVAMLEREISDWQEAWRHAKPRLMEQKATIEALQAELATRFGGTGLPDHAGASRGERNAPADSRFAEDVDAWIETFMSTPARRA